MLPAVNWRDPRLQPWAYLARGRRGSEELWEVVEVDRLRGVLVENCRTGGRLRVGPREIVPGWRLVRAAPSIEQAA